MSLNSFDNNSNMHWDKFDSINYSLVSQQASLMDDLTPKNFFLIKTGLGELVMVKSLKAGSFNSSVLLLIFTTLGSGVVLLPITMKIIGIVPSTVVFLLTAMICFFTLKVLILTAYEEKVFSYSALVKRRFNKSFWIFTQLAFHFGNLMNIVLCNKLSKLNYLSLQLYVRQSGISLH